MGLLRFAMTRRLVGLLPLPLLLVACGEKGKDVPSTPEEMYARVRELLQPNVEGEASDFAGAMQWLQKAAKAGHLQAQLDLGGIYRDGGKGVGRDGRAAYEWFCRATAQGSAAAEYFMGDILYRGQDMPRDTEGALAHWRKAAEAGVGEACYMLGVVLTGKEETRAEGVEWLRRAADEAAPKFAAQAACALGNLYAKGGAGLPQDGAESARWYKWAAEGGDARAQLVYALLLMQGEVVEKDMERGMAMLRLAAGQDNQLAIALLVNRLRNAENAGAYAEEAAAWAERLEQLRSRKTGSREGENGVTH